MQGKKPGSLASEADTSRSPWLRALGWIGLLGSLIDLLPPHVTSVGYDSNLRIEFHDGFTDDLARGDESVRKPSPPGPSCGYRRRR